MMRKLSIFVILLIALGVVLWPLFRPGFFVTDDGEWMIIRLSAFYQSLAGGQFPVRFLGRLNNSYGYPVANFLYPGFLYIGSLFRLFGMTFADAVKLILGVSVAGGAFAIFATLRTQFAAIPSLLGTLSFVIAPYLLFDLYERGSVGEVLALGVSAFVFFALTRRWAWLVAPAIALLLISHNTVALIILIATLPLIASRRMVLPVFIGVAMAAFFWLPALFEKPFVRFDAVTISDPSRYFIGLDTIALLGIGTVLALTIAKRNVFFWITLSGILLSLPVSFPIWSIEGLSKLVQFPYRFLVLPVLFGPWLIAEAAEKLRRGKLVLFGAVLILAWSVQVIRQLTSISFVNRPETYYSTNEGTTTVANEYMPRWVSDIPTKRPVETLEIVSGDATLSNRTFIGENMMMDIDAKEESTIQINKIYYPGWGVTINNNLVAIDYRNPLGIMRVTVPKGAHKLTVAFRETPLRFAADMVSLISFIIYCIFLIRLRIRL